MTTTMSIAIAVASAVTFLSFPALATARAPAAVDYSSAYGDPTLPQLSPRAPGITLGGPGEKESFLRRDPTMPQGSVLAPGIPLEAYVAERPDSSIDSDRPWQALRSFARLDL